MPMYCAVPYVYDGMWGICLCSCLYLLVVDYIYTFVYSRQLDKRKTRYAGGYSFVRTHVRLTYSVVLTFLNIWGTACDS